MRRQGLHFVAGSLGTAFMLVVACSYTPTGSPVFIDDDAQDANLRDAAFDGRRDARVDSGRPEGIPEGWMLDTTYDSACGFYAPGSAAVLPEPPRWEPCPATPYTQGLDCRLMAIDWTPSNPRVPGGAESAWHRSDGSIVLAAYRVQQTPGDVAVVTAPDGPVYSSFLVTDPLRCFAGTGRGYGDKFTYEVFDRLAGERMGAIYGNLASPALAGGIHFSEPGDGYSVQPSAFGVVVMTVPSMNLYSWDNGADLGPIWSRAEDEGLAQGMTIPTSTASFWDATSLPRMKVNVYTHSAGVRTFLADDTQFDRAMIGTDGHDLVWMEARKRGDGSWLYDSLSMMTAPFTSEPSQVVPRRLRSEDGDAMSLQSFKVGCGYAANDNGYHIRIVRLSDGWSWTLPFTDDGAWSWSFPLAIDCNELFTTVVVDGATRLARVRLDSLGPGVAPD